MIDTLLNANGFHEHYCNSKAEQSCPSVRGITLDREPKTNNIAIILGHGLELRQRDRPTDIERESEKTDNAAALQ